MTILSHYRLSWREALFPIILFGLGISIISGVLSTYQSIPSEAVYELCCSVALILTAIGYVQRKSWIRYTYLAVITLAIIFFLSRFRYGIPTENSGILLLIGSIGIAPFVLACLCWRLVSQRVKLAQ